MKPKFGLIVAYHDNYGGISPAIINRVNKDGSIDITDFPISGHQAVRSGVQYGFTTGKWHGVDESEPPVKMVPKPQTVEAGSGMLAGEADAEKEYAASMAELEAKAQSLHEAELKRRAAEMKIKQAPVEAGKGGKEADGNTLGDPIPAAQTGAFRDVS